MDTFLYINLRCVDLTFQDINLVTITDQLTWKTIKLYLLLLARIAPLILNINYLYVEVTLVNPA